MIFLLWTFWSAWNYTNQIKSPVCLSNLIFISLKKDFDRRLTSTSELSEEGLSSAIGYIQKPVIFMPCNNTYTERDVFLSVSKAVWLLSQRLNSFWKYL